jgi:hypothetical protein
MAAQAALVSAMRTGYFMGLASVPSELLGVLFWRLGCRSWIWNPKRQDLLRGFREGCGKAFNNRGRKGFAKDAKGLGQRWYAVKLYGKAGLSLRSR